MLNAIVRTEPLELVNDHDLTWLITFGLRELSSFTRRSIEEMLVVRALLTFGTMSSEVPTQPLFGSLARWAAA